MTQSQLKVFAAYGNDLSAVINETILPLAMSRLRGQLTMPKLISVDTADEAKKVGETIRVLKPIEFSEADEHGRDGSVATDIETEKVNIELNRHIYKEFKMSDREFTGSQPGTIPDAMAASVDVIARTINSAIFDLVKEVPYHSGDIGSTNSRDKKDMINAKKELQNAKILGDKVGVLTSDSEADLLYVFTTGPDQVAEKEGSIGRRFGIDWYSDIQAPYHFSGTASESAAIVLSANAVEGTKILSVSGAGANKTFVEGDVIKVAGTAQVFSVATDAVADADGHAVVQVHEEVSKAIASGSAVTVAGDHPMDVVFSKTAFLIAFRQLETPANTQGATIGSITDPETGVTLRLISWYNPSTESTHWKLETLFGCKAVAPERAIRMGGH